MRNNGIPSSIYILSPGDKDDISRYADRILARAMTVEVAVRTDRDPQQEEALHQVCTFNSLSATNIVQSPSWI